MQNATQIIGLISAFLTTLSFLPQAIKTWRTRSTRDLSPMMFSLFFLGIIGWLIYGFLKTDLPIILANIVTICLSGIILFFIFQGDKSYSVTHIGIYVKDIDRMKDFYCNTFNGRVGTKYLNPEKKFSSFFVQLGGTTRIELMHVEGMETGDRNAGHLAISVGSKKRVDQLTKKISGLGHEIVSKPRYTGDGYYESQILDPEGNTIEICL